MHDFSVLGGPGVDFPLFRPKVFIPTDKGSFYALAYVKWYLGWGLYENSGVMSKGALEPPAGHPLRRALEFYEQAIILPELADRVESFREVLKIAAENVWVISVSIDQPSLAVVKKGFRNVPQNLVNSWDYLSPGNAGLETFYFQNPHDSPGAVALMKREIMQTHSQIETAGQMAGERETPSLGVGRLIRNVFFGIGIILVILVGARHPYVGRRLVIMIPTLFIISLISFIIIQLPPGDYLTSLTAQLEQSGELADEQKIEQIEEMFLLHESVIRRYSKWIGMRWFFTFEEGDKGLLQGYMGRSMETLGAVNDLVGDRILLTILISMGAILFTWAIALPIGIYSAVRQYSVGDYLVTFIGFIGMCVPNFLFALLLLYLSSRFFGINISGLFSSEFSAQPEWTWGKVFDLLAHIWVPVLVIGFAGTASMIRVMRGNLLDELRRPYVTTARAKGLPPIRLLIKYPLRLALNPFISGIGVLFPQLISGGAIVALVLSLPTVGPLLLHALMSEDMYLAGSLLMVLSMLGIFGVLVSDLLLLALDPRIRMQGGSR